VREKYIEMTTVNILSSWIQISVQTCGPGAAVHGWGCFWLSREGSLLKVN